MRKAMGLGALIAASALLVGCGGSESVGLRDPSDPNTTDRNPGLYDPCALPDEAVSAAGADPATADEDFFGVQNTGFELCSWDAGWYYLTVWSTTHSFDEVTGRPDNIELKTVDTIPGRDAVMYSDRKYGNQETCEVAFAFSGGTLMVQADKKGSEEALEPPCAVAVRGSAALNDFLPQ